MIPGVRKITVPTFPKLTSWSYSRWETYEQCPLRVRYKYIDKIPDPPGPALERGTKIHTIIEDYLTGKTTKVPEEIEKLADYYRQLKANKPLVEREIAFTSKWVETDWFAADTWCRIKIDALFVFKNKPKTSKITDHKTGGVDKRTGKLKNDIAHYMAQLELYALATLIIMPKIESVETELAFVDAGETISSPKVFTRDDLRDLIMKWEDRIQPMLNDTIYSARPGWYCGWCNYSKKNGGQCQW